MFAGTTGAVDPFPVTGALTALQREDRDNVSIIEFAGNYDKSLGTGQPNIEPRAVIAREFYRTGSVNYFANSTYTAP